jgi:hypothetical protein
MFAHGSTLTDIAPGEIRDKVTRAKTGMIGFFRDIHTSALARGSIVHASGLSLSGLHTADCSIVSHTAFSANLWQRQSQALAS